MNDTPLSNSTNSPQSATQQALAGAFLAIKSANSAIRLQPPLPSVSVQGLEKVNDSLTVAQGHAKAWTETLSQNVQNQLQHIIDYNTTYSALSSSIRDSITTIGNGTTANPPTSAMTSLSGYLQALQDQVRQILYGVGGDATNPTDQSALGTYNSLTAYQSQVADDKTAFDGYAELAFDTESGVNAQIAQYQKDIQADNEAISKDTAMIGGGAAMMVTGIVICVVAVALAPETGGATIAAIGVLGVATIAGGAVMTGVAAHNLDQMQEDVRKKTVAIAQDRTELAGLTAINQTSSQIALQAKSIYGALNTILTNWQQLDNDLSNVVNALNLPQDELMRWIQNQNGGNPSYSVMATILSALFGTADHDWQAASTNAQTILNALASVVEFTLPTTASDASMNTIASESAKAKAA